MGKKVKNIQLLEEYRLLEADWNGYGAPPLSGELVDKCIGIVKELKVQPDVYPTGRDSIHFEYDVENGGYMEFELFLDRIEFYAELEEETINEVYTYEEMDWNTFLDEFIQTPSVN